MKKRTYIQPLMETMPVMTGYLMTPGGGSPLTGYDPIIINPIPPKRRTPVF